MGMRNLTKLRQRDAHSLINNDTQIEKFDKMLMKIRYNQCWFTHLFKKKLSRYQLYFVSLSTLSVYHFSSFNTCTCMYIYGHDFGADCEGIGS